MARLDKNSPNSNTRASGASMPRQPDPAGSPLRTVPGNSGAEFYCLRYAVRYSSFDCAVRTKFRTYHGCLNCEQGRFNLKRHNEELSRRDARRLWE